MKTQNVRILFIEDVEADVELAVRELQKSKIDLSWESVRTRSDFLSGLHDFNPDIVICNYPMPEFNNIETLRTILDTVGDIPVIIYTSTIDEETTVACIKLGVTDLVLKDNRKRLPFAVKEALANRETGRNTNELRQMVWLYETRYRKATDPRDSTAFLKDEQFRYLLVNRELQNIFGKPEAEIIGKTDFDLLPKETATRLKQADTRTLESRSLVITNEKISNRACEIRRFPVTLNNGHTGIGGFINEIGILAEADTQLRLQGTNLYLAETPVMTFDTNGTILSVNHAFTRHTGYPTGEMLGKNAIDLLRSKSHPDDFYKNIWNTINTGNVWHGGLTSQKKNGNLIHEEVTITPIIDVSGDVSHFISVRKNVTEQRVKELNSGIADWNYRDLIESTDTGICTITLEGNLLLVNDPLVRMLEYDTADKLLESNIQNVCKNQDQWRVLLETVLADGVILHHDMNLVTRKGNELNVVCDAVLDGNRIKTAFIDVTRFRRNEGDMTLARMKAEENDRLKSLFLSNMSRDIRIPVNSIHGFTGLLTSPGLKDTERAEYLNQINRSSDQLLRMINGFVELSKVANGQVTSNPISFDLNKMIKQIFAEYKPMAERKNLMLSYHTGLPDNSSRIRFDDQKLKLILSNLVDNAIKFTDKGVIDFGYEVKDSIVEMYVRDTGRGISPENQKNILERFRNHNDPYTRKFEGTGLGLPIAKAYVELLGGKMWVESQPGSGSNFSFTIPYLPVEELSRQAFEKLTGDLNLNERRILVAEDDETNYMFMERLLSKANATILRAMNGQEAVDRCATDSSIDLVLMDIHMPSMNGLDATRLIKSNSPGLPVIAVTAYAQSDDKETCLAAGCDDFIPKPIHRDELFLKLNNCLTN